MGAAGRLPQAEIPAIHAGLVALGDLEASTLGSYVDPTAVTRSASTRDTLEATEDSFGSERSGLDPQVQIIRAQCGSHFLRGYKIRREARTENSDGRGLSRKEHTITRGWENSSVLVQVSSRGQGSIQLKVTVDRALRLRNTSDC